MNASIPAQTFVAPPVPLDGLRFALLGFDVSHPHVRRLLSLAEARGATFVPNPAPDSVDLIVVHPPFLPTLSSPALPFTVSEFLRRRSVKFALGLRHLELCLEQERQLDPRRETLEVFPAGVLLVVDESALLSSDGVTERLAKLLGQAAAAAAAAAAGELRRQGVREPPPWPWAIKVHQGIFHALTTQKLKAQRAPALPTPEGNAAHEQAVSRVEGALKALHTLRQQGDRSVRGARLLGITREESGAAPESNDDRSGLDPNETAANDASLKRTPSKGGPLLNPSPLPQPVRDAVKIARKHAALCRAVFLVSESPATLEAAGRQRTILASGVDGAIAFLESLIAEMWGETLTASARPGPTASARGRAARAASAATAPAPRRTFYRDDEGGAGTKKHPPERTHRGGGRGPTAGAKRKWKRRTTRPAWTPPPPAGARATTAVVSAGGAALRAPAARAPDPAPARTRRGARRGRPENDAQRLWRRRRLARLAGRGLHRGRARGPPGTRPGRRAAPAAGAAHAEEEGAEPRATRAPRHGHVLHPPASQAGSRALPPPRGTRARAVATRGSPAGASGAASAATSPAAVGAPPESSWARPAGLPAVARRRCTARRTAALAEAASYAHMATRPEPTRRRTRRLCFHATPGAPRAGEAARGRTRARTRRAVRTARRTVARAASRFPNRASFQKRVAPPGASGTRRGARTGVSTPGDPPITPRAQTRAEASFRTPPALFPGSSPASRAPWAAPAGTASPSPPGSAASARISAARAPTAAAVPPRTA